MINLLRAVEVTRLQRFANSLQTKVAHTSHQGEWFSAPARPFCRILADGAGGNRAGAGSKRIIPRLQHRIGSGALKYIQLHLLDVNQAGVQ